MNFNLIISLILLLLIKSVICKSITSRKIIGKKLNWQNIREIVGCDKDFLYFSDFDSPTMIEIMKQNRNFTGNDVEYHNINDNDSDSSSEEVKESKTCRMVEHLIRALNSESNSAEENIFIFITANNETHPTKVRISDNGNLDEKSCSEIQDLLDTLKLDLNEDNIFKTIAILKPNEMIFKKRVKRNVNCKKGNVIKKRQSEGFSLLGLAMTPSSGSVAAFTSNQAIYRNECWYYHIVQDLSSKFVCIIKRRIRVNFLPVNRSIIDKQHKFCNFLNCVLKYHKVNENFWNINWNQITFSDFN